MLCDELKLYSQCYDGNDGLFYHHTEVDEAIAELKVELAKAIAERDGNQVCIDALKAEIKRKEGVGQRWFERCMEERTENLRLRRALWLARAEWARSSALSYHLIESHPDKHVAATYKRKANKWEKVKDKCLNKADEYK